VYNDQVGCLQLFSKYELSSSIELSLHIKTLLDVLKVFSASDVGAVTLVYPGDNGELVLKSSIHMDGGDALSQQNASLLPMAYAYVQTVEYSPTDNILDYLSDPVSSFLGMGTLFREALEDMDCAGKTVLIEMKQDPPQLTFSSQAQDIEIYVDVPIGKLTSFQCAQPVIEARYNRNYLKTALSALSRGRNESSPETHLCKVSIDPEGLMKVTHMWKLAGIEPGNEGPNEEQQIGSSSTQDKPSVKQAMVVTQFAILPMAEIEEDDDTNMSSRAL
jgi:hypothetical protein